MKVVKTFIQDTKSSVKLIADAVAIGVPDSRFEHIQGVPSDVWSVQHNLGKYPSVTILDTAGTEYEADVTHIDKNNAEIHFSVPFSGTTILN